MAYVPQKSEWKLEGFAELEQQLLDLAKGLRADQEARATIVKAAKQAMRPVEERVRQIAPYDPSPRTPKKPIHLRNTVRLDARIPNGRDLMSEYVKETDAAIAVVSVKRSAVSLAQEFGTSRIPARPFLRPTFQSMREDVVDSLKILLGSFIVQYAKKMERRRIK
jgi:HK97 gp10 family phage protein